MTTASIAAACPCGGSAYFACCGLYIDDGEVPPTAEALMRSRYTAYTEMNERYLLATWHISKRPATLKRAKDPLIKWLGLTVKQHVIDTNNPNHATVEFIAKFKVGGERADRQHEISRFVREEGRWFYLDGEQQ